MFVVELGSVKCRACYMLSFIGDFATTVALCVRNSHEAPVLDKDFIQ